MRDVIEAFEVTADTRPFSVKAELNQKQKDKVDSWVNKHKYYRYDGWQDEAFGGKSNGRHIVELGSTSAPIPVPQEVQDTLKAANVKITDYAKGVGEDSHGRQVRIGKILKRMSPVASKIFDEDKNRSGSKTNEYQVVFSRLPYDVAGMSTDRGWTSCQDLDDKRSMKKALEYDLKHGTVVAYLCKKGDDTIRNPTARIALKPYYAKGDPDGILRPEFTMYGSANDDLKNLFRKSISSWQNKYFKPDPSKTYSLVRGIYNDSLPTKILSDRAKKKFLKETLNCEGGNVSTNPNDRRIFVDVLRDASPQELCDIGKIPSAFKLLNTMSFMIEDLGGIKNLQKAIDLHPADMSAFFTFLSDKQREQVGKHCSPIQRFKLATSGSNARADLENLDSALKDMSPEEVQSLHTDLANNLPFMFSGLEALGVNDPLSKSICKNVILKSDTSQLSDLAFYMRKAMSSDVLNNPDVIKKINDIPISSRIEILNRSADLDMPKSVVDKCWKDLANEIPSETSQRAIHTDLDRLQNLDYKAVDAGSRKADGKRIVKAIKKYLKENGEHFNSRLLTPLENLIDRDTIKHLLGKVDPLKWNIGLNKDFIFKHNLDKDEVAKIENDHVSTDDLLKKWIHEQTNPAAIESRFMQLTKRKLSDHIKKVAYDRVRYLRGEHETKASLEIPMSVYEVFMSTANTPSPEKSAEEAAKKTAEELTRQHNEISAKIQSDARKKAAKAGHFPSENPDAHKAYESAVDHHIAHHEDTPKANALNKEAAKARVAYKKQLRNNKMSANTMPNKKETMAFHKRASEAEANHAENVKNLTKQREDNHKEVDRTFNKIVNDADKKAHAHATKLGHKKGSAAYHKAFTDVHMDHVLNHPDNEKHGDLMKQGNHIYGKLKMAQSEHKFAKLNLKNAEKAMKHHGLPLPKKSRAKKTTASVYEAFSEGWGG